MTLYLICMSHDTPHWCVTLSQVSSSTVAHTSQAQSRFQATYIDRIENDTLLSIVKGTATWRKDLRRETEGYYIYLPKLQEYCPIHYIEEDRLWVYVAINE